MLLVWIKLKYAWITRSCGAKNPGLERTIILAWFDPATYGSLPICKEAHYSASLYQPSYRSIIGVHVCIDWQPNRGVTAEVTEGTLEPINDQMPACKFCDSAVYYACKKTLNFHVVVFASHLQRCSKSNILCQLFSRCFTLMVIHVIFSVQEVWIRWMFWHRCFGHSRKYPYDKNYMKVHLICAK